MDPSPGTTLYSTKPFVPASTSMAESCVKTGVPTWKEQDRNIKKKVKLFLLENYVKCFTGVFSGRDIL